MGFFVAALLSCASSPACKQAQQPYPQLEKRGVSWTVGERSAELESCLNEAAGKNSAGPGFCELRLELRRRALQCMEGRGWTTAGQ
jgi:hypothetical protein